MLHVGKSDIGAQLSGSVCRRWAWNVSWRHANSTQLVFSAQEWEDEWSELVKLASQTGTSERAG